MTTPDELWEAAKARNIAKKQVVDWLKSQGELGNLYHNSSAPGWHAYKESEDTLGRLLSSVE